MADRSIFVRLRAEVSEYLRNMQQAAKATEEVADSGDKTSSALGRMVKSARDNRQEWSTTGTALLAVGGAITGIGVAALKTGISYNTLQQTSRAALTTLLGSAEAANAQMDKLDDFARNSPFAKQVFIQAQQQMLAFGMSADRVVPTLDAIQNAVASMGGSNAEIAEVAEIVARIGAVGKITSVDLQMLGRRVGDVAEIIGERMGYSGAQIREQITAGTLDAQDAIDALVAGMSERFEGGAANVKNTFEGAIDRVKAAWRDLSAELAEPLVSKDGGGLLIDWTNQVADLMRWFQALPQPIKIATAAGGGLVGVVATLTGGAMLLLPRLVDLYDALGKMGAAGRLGQRSMRGLASAMPTAARVAGWAAAFSAVAIALGQFIDTTKDRTGIEGTASALQKMVDSSAGIDAIFAKLSATSGLGKQFNDLEGAMDFLIRPGFWDRANDFAGNVMNVLPFGNLGTAEGSYARADVIAQFNAIGDALGRLVSSGHADAAADQFKRLSDMWVANGGDLEDLKTLLPGYTEALAGVENQAGNAASAQGEFGDATERATERAEAQATELQRMIDLHREMTNQALASRDAQRGYEQALDDATAALEKNGTTLDITTQKGRDNEKALDAIATAGINLIDNLREQGASQEDLQAKMQRTRDDFIEVAEQMGMSEQAASNLADQLGLIPANVRVDVDVATANAERNIANFIASWSGKTIETYLRLSTSAAGQVHGNPRIGFGATGGVVGYAGGGKVPGTPPAAPWVDNVAAMTQHGTPYAIRSGEWIINERQSRKNDRWLRAINSGLNLDEVYPRMAGGGVVGGSVSSSVVTSGDTHITLTIDGSTLRSVRDFANLVDNARRYTRQMAGVR